MYKTDRVVQLQEALEQGSPLAALEMVLLFIVAVPVTLIIAAKDIALIAAGLTGAIVAVPLLAILKLRGSTK